MRGSRFHEEFPVTAFLLLFNIAFFFLETIATVKGHGDLAEMGAVLTVDPRVTRLLGSLNLADLQLGEYWRLISATFLHANVFHLLMNMVVLFDMGRYCEPFLSSWKLFTVYVACALGGSLASAGYGYFTNAFRSSVGASGALAGLIGLLLVYAVKHREDEMRDALFRWVLIMVALSLVVSNLDHAGHLGGFITGCMFGLTAPTYMTSRAAARWRWPGYAAALVVLACLGKSAWEYFTKMR